MTRRKSMTVIYGDFYIKEIKKVIENIKSQCDDIYQTAVDDRDISLSVECLRYELTKLKKITRECKAIEYDDKD